jgi:hypothetical protein
MQIAVLAEEGKAGRITYSAHCKMRRPENPS